MSRRPDAEVHRDLYAARMNALRSATADLLWVTAADGQIVEAQPDWEAFTGQSFEEYRGSGWLAALHAEDRDRARDVWEQALDAGTNVQAEYRVRRHDGEFRVMTTRAAPVLDDEGQVREWVGITSDVTESRRRQNELELGRAQLEAAFRDAPALIALLSGPDHVFELANLAYQRTVGERPLIGLSVRQALPEIEGQGFFELLDQVFDTGVPYVANEVRVMLDRAGEGVLEESWVNFTYQPVHGRDGVHGIMVFAVDVTEQVRSRQSIEEQAAELEQQTDELQAQAVVLEKAQAELEVANQNLLEANEDLRESEARFRTLAEAIPQLAWIARPDGHIFWYNQRWYEYTGTTPEQMEGWGWQSVHDPEMLPRVLERWQASIATGEPFDMEFPLRGADGTFRWFLTRVMPVRDSRGRITGWFGTNTDVDERRQMEQSLDLARRQAEAANLAKSAFLAHMSHELRTPINAIVGYAQLLEMGVPGPLNEAQTAQVRRVIVSSEHLLALVAGILDLAKIEAGAADVHEEDMSLREVVASAVELIESMATRKGLNLQGLDEVSPSLVAVGDPDCVRQILANLLTNAVKFTPQGGTIRVETALVREAEQVRELEGAGAWLRAVVVDGGIGIPPDQLDRIFEPFYQVDSGYTREAEGTGLGLTISRKLARAMGGDLTAESEPGKGSRFTLWLKAAERGSPADRVETPRKSGTA